MAVPALGTLRTLPNSTLAARDSPRSTAQPTSCEILAAEPRRNYADNVARSPVEVR